MRYIMAIVGLATFLSAAAETTNQTVTLDVQNMTCASCPLTVRQVLKTQAGVLEAKVDLASHSAQVKYDPAKVQPAQFAKAVTDAGFPTSVHR